MRPEVSWTSYHGWWAGLRLALSPSSDSAHALQSRSPWGPVVGVIWRDAQSTVTAPERNCKSNARFLAFTGENKNRKAENFSLPHCFLQPGPFTKPTTHRLVLRVRFHQQAKFDLIAKWGNFTGAVSPKGHGGCFPHGSISFYLEKLYDWHTRHGVSLWSIYLPEEKNCTTQKQHSILWIAIDSSCYNVQHVFWQIRRSCGSRRMPFK